MKQSNGVSKAHDHPADMLITASAASVAAGTTASDIMGCFTPEALPVLSSLARGFAVCDHWFSSMPGPTWPNRFFIHAASSAGLDHSPSTQTIASSILLNQAMTPGTGGLSQLGVPIYNILGLPGFNNPTTVSAVKASDGQNGFSDLFTTQGILRGDIFELPAGPFQLAGGGQFVHEKLDTGAGAFRLPPANFRQAFGLLKN